MANGPPARPCPRGSATMNQAGSKTSRTWVWGRARGHRRAGGRRHHDPRHQPGARRMRGRLLPFGWGTSFAGGGRSTAAGSASWGSSPPTSTRAWRRPLRRALRHRGPRARQMGRDGLDPRDQPGHEPRHGGHGRVVSATGCSSASSAARLNRARAHGAGRAAGRRAASIGGCPPPSRSRPPSRRSSTPSRSESPPGFPPWPRRRAAGARRPPGGRRRRHDLRRRRGDDRRRAGGPPRRAGAAAARAASARSSPRGRSSWTSTSSRPATTPRD